MLSPLPPGRIPAVAKIAAKLKESPNRLRPLSLLAAARACQFRAAREAGGPGEAAALLREAVVHADLAARADPSSLLLAFHALTIRKLFMDGLRDSHAPPAETDLGRGAEGRQVKIRTQAPLSGEALQLVTRAVAAVKVGGSWASTGCLGGLWDTGCLGGLWLWAAWVYGRGSMGTGFLGGLWL